jgi:hypothetical protein
LLGLEHPKLVSGATATAIISSIAPARVRMASQGYFVLRGPGEKRLGPRKARVPEACLAF